MERLAEDPSEKKERQFSRVSVRIGDVQVDLEGTHSNVKEIMEKDVLDFIEKLQKTISEKPGQALTPEVVEGAEETVPPLGKPSTTTEALSSLFKTDWGKKPRTLSDVMDALQANGLYYRKAAVAKILVDLIKDKQLRRIGSRGSFQYVAS